MKISWQPVKSETIVNSLKNCGVSNTLDGSEDEILYEESDASSENNNEDDLLVVTTIFCVSMMNKIIL
jgi:mannose/fructose-specific phosphotransferase system component IIA